MPRLLCHGVPLLPGQNDPCVGFSLGDVGGVQAIEMCHVETVQSPTLHRGMLQLLLICTPNHARIMGDVASFVAFHENWNGGRNGGRWGFIDLIANCRFAIADGRRIV